MEKQLKDLCIKCEGKKLREFLAKYTKPRLKAILDVYGEKLPSAAKKQEMSDCAYAAVTAEIASIFSDSAKDDRAGFLAKAAKNGLTVCDDADFEKVRSYYEKGLIFLTESSAGAKVNVPAEVFEAAGIESEADFEEKYVQLQMPIDNYDQADDDQADNTQADDDQADDTPTHDDQADDTPTHDTQADDDNKEKAFAARYEEPSKRSERENEIIKYTESLTNMCGITTVTHIRDQWNLNHPHDSLSPNAIIKALKKSGREDGFYLEEPVFAVTNLLESVEKGREVTEKYVRGEAYRYASEEEIEAFEDAPQIDNSEEYIYLRAYLERAAGEESATRLINELFLLAMHDPQDEEIMTVIEKSGVSVPENEKDALLLMIREWIYFLHIWACKGYMPSELKEEKLEGRNFRLEKGHRFKKIAKMGRNEPCPCLSGRKFKSCCMKKINSLS